MGVGELTAMRPRRRGLLARAKSAVLALGLGLGLATAASCASPERDGTVEPKAVTIAAATAGPAPGDLDVLFMIDDSSGMASMQTKLAAQIPSFIDALESLPNGLPNIHIAVVSSDLGAPGRFDLRHLHDGRRPGAVSPLAQLRQLDARRRPDVRLQRRRERQLHGQPGRCPRLHHAARRHGVRLRTPARLHRARARCRRRSGRPPGTPAFCVRRRSGHHHPQQHRTIARPPQPPTSIRSTTGRTT